VLLVHPAQDATVPPARSVEYVDAARARGGDVTLVQAPDEGHRDVIDPGSASWAAAADWLAALEW
jgi:dipeptidyl aminopeptidase/acylaminoacyl peptidase